MPDTKDMKVTAGRFIVPTDPELEVFSVEVDLPRGVWRESFRTEGEIKAFFKGLELASNVSVDFSFLIPHVPTKHESKDL